MEPCLGSSSTVDLATERPIAALRRAARAPTSTAGHRKHGLYGQSPQDAAGAAFVIAAKKLLRSMVAIASVCASNPLMHLQDAQFSNNPSSTFGPPGFASAAFAYKGGALNLPVQLSY